MESLAGEGESEEVKKQKDELNEELKQLLDFLPSMEDKLADAKANEKAANETQGEDGVGSSAAGDSCISEKSALQEAMRQVEMKEAAENGTGGVDSVVMSSTVPAKSITHLVRRKDHPLKAKPTALNQEDDEAAAKRKADANSDTESVPAKKAKIEENGTTVSTDINSTVTSA